ncbi:MAG: site-2 protease family protein [Candidatus Thorarchaeota archaeon]
MSDDIYSHDILTYPLFSELNAVISRHFEVTDSAIEYGMPVFLFRWPNGIVPHSDEQTRVFDELDSEAERLGVWPVVRWRNRKEGEYVAHFVRVQKLPPSDVRINYALFIATMCTIAIGGFLQATNPVFLSLFYPNGWTYLDIALVTFSFIASIMGIFFTHEMGHYLMAKRRRVEATPPYFIPGIPDLGGTFGAFIQQRSPPRHRRDLFDLGVAGPLAGFAVTVVVLVVGYLLSLPITAEQLAAIKAEFPDMVGELGVPLLYLLLDVVFAGFIPEGGTLYLHPIGFAAWVGCLVTSLNLFPVSQLDGGHALRAIVPARVHKEIGYIAIIAMLLAGFFMMAILVLLLSQGREHPGPLNDTVPLSRGRQVLFILVMIVLILCIPPLSLMMF